jgi:hypothetical protein
LKESGVQGGFFFPHEYDGLLMLNKGHPQYSVLLAAQVEAWLYLVEHGTGNLTPKQAAIKYLKEHAFRFALTDENGDVRERKIEELAANVNFSNKPGPATLPS